MSLLSNETSKYFFNNELASIAEESSEFAKRFIEIENDLVWKLTSPTFGIRFDSPVGYVYNPLEYASEVHCNYVNSYCNGPKKILFLGMNPGPWGMMQTGVPFGEVTSVRDWLKLSGNIRQPRKHHPLKRVQGFDCKRSEVSGTRFWSLAKRLSGGDPHKFFSHSFIYNYFPLVFLSRNGINITPAELKTHDQKILKHICDESLARVLLLLETEIVIAVGRYAENKATAVIKEQNLKNLKVIYIPHPSPRNPANGKNWPERASQVFITFDLMKYFM